MAGPTHGQRSIPAPSQALVTKDFKYLLWPEFDYEQLFDLRTDRAEEHDVAVFDQVIFSFEARFAGRSCRS